MRLFCITGWALVILVSGSLTRCVSLDFLDYVEWILGLTPLVLLPFFSVICVAPQISDNFLILLNLDISYVHSPVCLGFLIVFVISVF